MNVTKKEMYAAAARLQEIDAKIKELKKERDEIADALKAEAIKSGGEVVVYNGRSGFIVKAVKAVRAALGIDELAATEIVRHKAPNAFSFVSRISPKAIKEVLNNPPDEIPGNELDVLKEVYEPTTYFRISLKRITKGA